jgi:hypothetical protein
MNALLIAKIFLGAFSMGLFVMVIGLEVRWWRLRAATRQVGRVVDQIPEPGVEGGICYHPVIQVGVADDLFRFKSCYSKEKAFVVGEEVPVLFDPHTRRAEWYSASHRYTASVALLFFATAFGLLAFCIQK